MPQQVVDARLLVGSALFGLGWALADFCLGPALASLGLNGTDRTIFVLGMGTGMAIFPLTKRHR